MAINLDLQFQSQSTSSSGLNLDYNAFSDAGFDTTAISGISGSTKYFGGIYFDGKIFLVPDNANNVGIIDPVKKTIDITTIPAPGSSRKWGGAVIAKNNKAYLIPQSYGAIGILDLENLTLDVTTMTGSFGQAYYSGFLAHNDMIYCAPYNTDNTLKINPSNDTYSTFGSYGVFNQKCQGVVLSSYNGMGYVIPRWAGYVAIINPFNDTVDRTTITGLAGGNKWAGGAEGSDYKIYCAANSSNSTLIIDPATNTVDTTTITGFNSYSGAVAMPNDKIYCAPISTNTFLEIDVPTQTASETVVPFSNSNGIVCANNGEAFCIPSQALHSLIIKSGEPRIPLKWCLRAYNNNY